MDNRPASAGRQLTRLGAGAMLPEVLRDLGVEPKAVFESAGLDIDSLSEPDAMIALGDLARLIRLSVQASSRPDLGILVARRAGVQAAGLLGRLFRNAGDLRSALQDLIRYGHLNHRAMVPALTVSDGVATLQFALAGPFGGAAVVSEDSTVGGIVNQIRALLGANWRPSAVMLSHAPGSHAASYRRFFCAPVRFNAIRTALEFPAADLDRAPVGGASDRHAEIEAAANAASVELAIGFEEKVLWLIRARLADADLSVEQIAALTDLSRRSLNRRLAARGVTVASLLRSVRFATARQLLVESDTPLSDVAAAIGYAEPSVFSTAFRRWSGVSPRAWRKQHGRAQGMGNRPRAVATEHQAIPTGALDTRVGPGSVLPDLLRDLGVDPQPVFDAAGVDIVLFADPDASIPLAHAARLLRLSMEATGRLDLGLLLAGRAGEEVTGLLGRLVSSAADLRSVLHDIVRYGHLNQREGAITLTVSGDVAALRFALTGPFDGVAIVFEDLSVGRFFRMIRASLGGAWRPTAVMLSHAPPPGMAASYRQFFGAPVRFNAVRTALEFPAADLERPTVGGASDRRAELQAAASNAYRALAIGFEEKVRWTIHARLSDPDLSVEQVAALNGMSRRSLNRRLAERGVTVASLLHSVRFATARRLLVESETPLSEIALAIGYAEPSIFSAAFRRWSGVSPREWRKQHGRG